MQLVAHAILGEQRSTRSAPAMDTMGARGAASSFIQTNNKAP